MCKVFHFVLTSPTQSLQPTNQLCWRDYVEDISNCRFELIKVVVPVNWHADLGLRSSKCRLQLNHSALWNLAYNWMNSAFLQANSRPCEIWNVTHLVWFSEALNTPNSLGNQENGMRHLKTRWLTTCKLDTINPDHSAIDFLKWNWHSLFCVIEQVYRVNTVLSVRLQWPHRNNYNLCRNKGDFIPEIMETIVLNGSIWDLLDDYVNISSGSLDQKWLTLTHNIHCLQNCYGHLYN